MQPEEGTGWLLELLSEVQLQQYFLRLRDDLNVTRLSHFEYVKNEDLEKIGMGRPGRWGHGPCPSLSHRPVTLSVLRTASLVEEPSLLCSVELQSRELSLPVQDLHPPSPQVGQKGISRCCAR